MIKKWLILDCNFLCHRIKYSMGGLSNGNSPTGIIYGFFRTVFALQKQFNTPFIIFAWDSKHSRRQEIYKKYKANRKNKFKNMTKKEIKLEKGFRKQMVKLRRVYLPAVGYKNIFIQKGYEADDVIASIAMNLSMKDSAVVITSDQDLYQLLEKNISIYDPNKSKLITINDFKRKYKIAPSLWAIMKALAGCTTDNVKGIKAVGELTALKYIKNKLNKTSKVYKRIRSKKSGRIYDRNISLVGLPLAGTVNPILRNDKISIKGWKKVSKKLGMNFIKTKPPIFKRKKINNG